VAQNREPLARLFWFLSALHVECRIIKGDHARISPAGLLHSLDGEKLLDVPVEGPFRHLAGRLPLCMAGAVLAKRQKRKIGGVLRLCALCSTAPRWLLAIGQQNATLAFRLQPQVNVAVLVCVLPSTRPIWCNRLGL
jgi:hypothetical protein